MKYFFSFIMTFDNVPYKTVFTSLDGIGVSGKILQLIDSFFSTQKRVIIEYVFPV